MAKRLRIFGFLATTLFTFSLLANDQSVYSLATDDDYVIPVGRNELKIMSYNVQNLFDADHDRAKEDYEFLPKSHPQKENCDNDSCKRLDWTFNKVQMKMAQIKDAISAQGPLPDILVLSEVENKVVVSQLAEELGFDSFAMTNSPDKRGIDTAVMFRKNKLTAKKFEERELKKNNHPTRNLSVIVFELSSALGGGYLGVFPNHWPSQSPSNGNGRMVAAQELREFVDEMREKYSDNSFQFVITGDFNCIETERPHPIESIILDKTWSAKVKDVRELAKKAKNPMMSKMPKATYYYGVEDAWNEFDRFLISNELADGEGLDLDPMSYRIHAPSFMTKKNQKGEAIPFRYNHFSNSKGYIGYSDHFAIVMKLKFNR